MRGLWFRLLCDGDVALEQTVDTPEEAPRAAFAAGERAVDLVGEGHVVALQVRDPDGLIFPSSEEWQTVQVLTP